jgi:UDP-glucose:(heptosyl)LPS alpha-1,3-glucosyltransferase
MRLAIVRLRYGPFGGAERFIERATESLARDGVEIHVVAERWDGPRADGVSVHEVPVRARTRAGRLRAFRRGAAEVVRRGGFDLVQAHERMTGVDVYRAGDGVHAAWLERLARARGPFARFALKLDPFHRDVLATERAMAADPRLHFVANSALVERELRTALGVPGDRITRLENGVDLARFGKAALIELRAGARRELGVGDDVPVVLLVGSGFERKGVFPLAAALAHAKMREVRLVVVGKDRRPSKLARLASRIGVSARLHALGPREDVRPWLAAADLFALPSLYDPMPNAALEALAAGLPVVTTPDTGVAEAVATADAGVVAAADPDALAAAIERIRSDLAGFSARAERLARNYDAEVAWAAWRAFYRRRLGR